MDMIPKVIHYCWFGGNPKSEKMEACIASWRKYCPDYVIKEWNEGNYDVKKNQYMYEAYQSKKWAFVSDYARIDIVHSHGGIYLDTDVELIKNIDDLLDYSMFCGFESEKYVNLGLGYGAEKGHRILKQLLEYYDKLHFILRDGSLNLVACPIYQSKILERNGFAMNNQAQEIDGTKVFPNYYFSPKNYETGEIHIDSHTYSIHHYDGTWMDEISADLKKLRHRLCAKLGNSIGSAVYLIVQLPVFFSKRIRRDGWRETYRYCMSLVRMWRANGE